MKGGEENMGHQRIAKVDTIHTLGVIMMDQSQPQEWKELLARPLQGFPLRRTIVEAMIRCFEKGINFIVEEGAKTRNWHAGTTDDNGLPWPKDFCMCFLDSDWELYTRFIKAMEATTCQFFSIPVCGDDDTSVNPLYKRFRDGSKTVAVNQQGTKLIPLKLLSASDAANAVVLAGPVKESN